MVPDQILSKLIRSRLPGVPMRAALELARQGAHKEPVAVSFNDLARAIDVSRKQAAKAVQELEAAGLVIVAKDGQRNVYRIQIGESWCPLPGGQFGPQGVPWEGDRENPPCPPAGGQQLSPGKGTGKKPYRPPVPAPDLDRLQDQAALEAWISENTPLYSSFLSNGYKDKFKGGSPDLVRVSLKYHLLRHMLDPDLLPWEQLTPKTVLAGAHVLGRLEQAGYKLELIAPALAWAQGDEFWRYQVNTLDQLLGRKGRPYQKAMNLLAAYKRDLARQGKHDPEPRAEASSPAPAEQGPTAAQAKEAQAQEEVRRREIWEELDQETRTFWVSVARERFPFLRGWPDETRESQAAGMREYFRDQEQQGQEQEA